MARGPRTLLVLYAMFIVSTTPATLNDIIFGCSTDSPVNGSSVETPCNDSVTTNPSYCFGDPCYHGTCVCQEAQHGGYNYRCVCHPGGWVGPTCNICCSLDCNEGLCRFDVADGGMYCDCLHPDYDPSTHCTELRPVQVTVITITELVTVGPETPGWLWYVVGVVCILTTALAAVLVLLPMYLWKRRNILIMEIVYFFQKFETEDTDGKPKDVFLSYLSLHGEMTTDEAFVSRYLHPKLEREMNLDVYVDYKDSIPGQCKAEGILDAIANSRRTILVITPEYLTSEWPRFELQVAQHEMMKLRHLIVPIILRDISELRTQGQLGPLFRHVLDSVPCLVWPGTSHKKKEDKFWKRLKLSMPKKKSAT